MKIFRFTLHSTFSASFTEMLCIIVLVRIYSFRKIIKTKSEYENESEAIKYFINERKYEKNINNVSCYVQLLLRTLRSAFVSIYDNFAVRMHAYVCV